jgi:trimeric autotransporter adhesin
MRVHGFRCLALLSVVGASILGCGVSSIGVSGNAPIQLSGRVHGGQQPISGATIQLYSVGTNGDGSSAASLLNVGPKTDSNGNFDITGAYTCPSASSLVYIVATGGNPGLAQGTNNSAISLLAALGPCGNLSADSFINIDEITTVVAANTLAPFTTSASAIGSSSTDSVAMAAAFNLANELTNWSTGTSPGVDVPTGTTVPVSEIDTIADILAACVNSTGGTAGDSSTCGNLFSLTSPSGTSPATDTLSAALHLAISPSLNTSQLFALSTATAPFQPTLTIAPQDFSVGLIVSAGLQPSVTTISFGSESVGSTASVQSFTLTNNSQSPVSISSVSIGGINRADFAQTNNCPASLNVGAACTMQVTFAPSATGGRIAVLLVGNNSPNPQLLINLVGVGTSSAVVAPQLLSTSPSSVTVGSPSTTVTVSGTGFTSSSVVSIYGVAQPTTFISAQSLSFTLSSQYLGSVTSLYLSVSTSGYISNTLLLPVVNPVPVLASISPSSVTAGSPNFQLTVTGSGLSTASTVVINGTSHVISSTNGTTATVTVGASEVASVGTLNVTIVNPGPGGGTSAAQQLQVIGSGNRLRTLSYPTTDIVWDSVHSVIYAAVSSTSATNANSILAIDPLQGTVVSTQTMPSQAGQLAITDDGSYLYVYLPATSQISRLILPSLTPDITWSLTSNGATYSARDIETAPGQPHTLAVAHGNLTIYDDGVARQLVPAASYPSPSFDTVAWGNDATTLFGTMAVTSGGPEYIFTVNQNGPTLTTTIPTVFGSFVSRLKYDQSTGRLYDGYGDAVNATSGASVGSFTVQNTLSYEQNPFAIDPVHGKAFFLNANASNSSADIQAFDSNSFSFIDSIDIPNLSGSKIVQWGASGLAVGGGTQIFLIDGSFVSPTGVSSQIGSYIAQSPTLTSVSPQTVAAGSGTVDITLSGVNFTQAAVVTWNGQTFPVNLISSTQAIVTIPGSMLAQPLSSSVFISNGPGTENSAGVPFTVLPDLGPNTQIAAMDISGQDMVWDSIRGLLYIAVPDSGVPNGNSIVVVDPARTALQNVVYTGNQPSALGLSDDGQYLYTGLQTLAAVKRFKLSDFSLDLTIPLNSGSVSESFAGEVKVAPGQPQTIAVSMGNKSIEPRDAGGLAIFDNATQRPNVLSFGSGDTYKLAWGQDSTRLYAHSDPEIQGQSISVLAIDNAGVSSRVAYDCCLTDIGLRPHYDSGTNLVYSDGGRVTNPVDGTAAGVIQSQTQGLMVPDSGLNRAFVLQSGSTSGSYVLDIFDLGQQTYLNSITIPNVLGSPTQLVRWGTQGIAFLTDTYGGAGPGMLYILQGSDISGLTNPPPGSIALSPSSVIEDTANSATITVTGTNFLPTSTVLVNGVSRTTTFISSSQLSFQLTAADQAFAQYLSVAVTSVSTGGATSPATSLAVNNPIPTITSLSNQKFLLGSSATTITISGSGFVPATTIQFNGSPRVTTYLSPTQVTATITSTDLLTAGTFALTAFNPGPGGGSSAASTLEVDNPSPTISGVVPSTIATGSPGRAVSVSGTGFLAGTIIQVGGTPRTTTYVTPSLLSVLFTATDFATPGNLSVVAINPAPGGGTSAAATIAVNNGIPGPITLSPSLVLQGASTPTSVTVNGSNFLPGSVVQIGGSSRTTTYISSTQLTFLLTVADQANAATLLVVVSNPSPGGGSTSAFLTVATQTQTPAISAVSPTQFVLGSSGGYLYVTGTGFTANSIVEWNNAPLTTSYLNSTYLLSQVPANLLTTAGVASITVNSATATPPLSNSLSVSIVNPPAPTLTSISPNNGPINTAFTATLTGTNFTSNSVVDVNGAAVQTTFVSTTQLTASVPASAIGPGNINFTVTTPAPGGGTSTTVVYTAYIPIANNSMVYNPVDKLFYLSVPGSAGAPYANSIVSLDPVTGALGTPIFVGSEPNRLALSSDGQSLWVGLDGASAIRKVDLVAHTAGLQFALSTQSNFPLAVSPVKAVAIVAVPGQADSVIVAAANEQSVDSTLTIYDSGVPRGSSISVSVLALAVDGSKSELYTDFGSAYRTYSYNSSGLVAISSGNPGSSIVNSDEDRLQLVPGLVYTDYGQALNSETGTLAGAFSPTTSTPTSTTIDSTLGLAFVLDSTAQYSSLPNNIQIFNLSNYESAGSNVIPVNLATTNLYSPVAPVSRLTRWGTNGLAFRNNVSVYALRSNLVMDLSTSPADLGVTMTTSGSNITGTQSSYVATISNAGPADASEVSFTALAPSTGVMVSAIPSSGSCSITTEVTCSLGELASGATATINLIVNQLTPGTSTMTVQISASQTDPNLENNQADSMATIAGETYTAFPALLSISPSTILAGTSDTSLTVTGTGFGAGSSIVLDGVTLPTNVMSATQLSAIVPAASVANLGWHLITVSNPSPGGGVSTALPLSVFNAIKAGVNHILYDPFSRKILATLGSATASGNSIETLTPEAGSFTTPIGIGSEPTRMALSDDGQILYVLTTGSNQIVRYNMLTQQIESEFDLTPPFGSSTDTTFEFAMQPGSEDTFALTQGVSPTVQIIDFDPANHTAAVRPSNSGSNQGFNPQFLDPSTLFVEDNSYSLLDSYTISSSGLNLFNASTSSSVLPAYGPFKLANGMAFTSYGGVADVTTQPARPLGTFPLVSVNSYNLEADFVPDPTLGRAFYLAGYDGTNYTAQAASGIAAFDSNTFEPAGFFPLNIADIEGTTASNAVDLLRWGQDGLAALTSSGTIYLLRGPAVVPQLLQTNAPAVLSSGVPGTLQHGSGNVVLTLSGSGFLPGAAVMWNGCYRTTTIVDSSHVSVAIPASDLAQVGTAIITIINPGAAASAPLTISIN